MQNCVNDAIVIIIYISCLENRPVLQVNQLEIQYLKLGEVQQYDLHIFGMVVNQRYILVRYAKSLCLYEFIYLGKK